MGWDVRALTNEDHDGLLALWRRSPGVGLSAADGPGAIRRYLERNPGMSFIARADGRVVGAVLCGHDGRRGFLHHLAVDPAHQGRGLGRDLVQRCLAALRAEGIDKCHLFVKRTNEPAVRFWRRSGWHERDDLWMYSIDLPCDETAPERGAGVGE
jgi:ribosomal protein S18 acetylase RimI-like enzyme